MSNTIEITEKRRNLMFINLLIASIASTLLMTALNTALVPIIADMGVDANTGQWLVSGYALAEGIIMPLTAFLIRRFPTRRLYLVGLFILIAGLIIAMTAGSFPVLLFGRIMQACGNGIVLSMTQVFILTLYPAERRGTVMGWYGLAVGAAPVIAPTLGGLLVDLISWRAIFALGLIVIVVALIMALPLFKNVLPTEMARFDMLSFILSVFAFGGITLGVGNLSSYGISNPFTWLPLLIGAATLVIFIWRQFSVEEPFLNLSIFKNRNFTVAVISVMLTYFVMMGASILMPLCIQTVMGYSATISGLVILPGALANTVLNPFTGRIYDKLGIKTLFIVGAILMFVSSLCMYFLSAESSLILLAVIYAVRCAGVCCLMMPLTTWGQAGLERSKVADATALLSSFRTIAGAIGSAVSVGLMTMVQTRSFALGETEAGMRGINAAFLFIAFCAAVLVAFSVFLVRKKNAA